MTPRHEVGDPTEFWVMSNSRTAGITSGLAQIVVSELSCAALGDIWKVTPDVCQTVVAKILLSC